MHDLLAIIFSYLQYLKLVNDESLLEEFMVKAKAFFPRGKIFYTSNGNTLSHSSNGKTSGGGNVGHDQDEMAHQQQEQQQKKLAQSAAAASISVEQK